MLSATDFLFAAVDVSSESLVAFARVLTDRTYVALVLDVIVAPEHRGRGLGGLLIERICSDPVLKQVASIELVCQTELFRFYRRSGFTENVGRSRLMRRTSNPLRVDSCKHD
jgi:predicted GNAT family N-acyltransferase